MSSRKRTNPPPESMAGSFVMSLGLGVVGLALGLGFGNLFGSLRFLTFLDRGVLGLDLVDRFLSSGAFGRFRLDGGLRRRRGGYRLLGLLRRLAGPIGFRRHRLLPNQFDDGHRCIVALACLHLDDAGVAALTVGEEWTDLGEQ